MRKLLTALSALVLVMTAHGGTATYNFDTDPSSTHKITGNNPQPWRATGGKTGGFLAITYPEGSQSTTVVFPDIDAGKIVTAFTFECDLRVGNPRANVRPADGFSVSFARAGDPVIETGSGFAGGIPEAGTTTGIAVSFDTWSGNTLPDGADIEGIIVRVDNKTVLRQPMPTRNGACDDTTSLQTGPRDLPYWDGGGDPQDPASWAGLCWQPFSIELDPAGKLTVKYKGRTILDKYQTTYFPTAGSLVLAGRTGGADENTHFDNIKLTTQSVTADSVAPSVPSGLASVGVAARVVAFKWNASTDDSGKVAYEIDRDGTLLTQLAVTPTTYLDAGLKPNTTYNYKVRAVDPSGNKSAYSTALTLKTDVETLVDTKGLAKFDIWLGVTGNAVQTLLDEPRYPASPDLVLVGNSLNSRLVFPDDSHEGYGGRMSAWLTPAESGQYELFIRSDDASQLFLSTDDKEANATVIAEETGCCGAFEETGASETSAPVALQAGKRYYIQALWKEGTGGDFCQVAWRKVGDATAASALQPIPGTFLSTLIDTKHGPPIIQDSPKSQTVAAGASVTFSVTAVGTTPLTYQWQRGGIDIPGANSTSLTVSGASSANFGLYRVVVSNFEGSTTSAAANLTVTGLPTALFIHGTGGPNAADLAAMNRLQTLGLQVTAVGAVPSATTDATGKAMIMISSTVASGEVADKFRNTTVGIVNWESALQDNFDETDRAGDADGSTRGVTAGQSQLRIVAANHPVAAGLPAGLVNFSGGDDVSWGVVGPGATIIAAIADDPTRGALYVHDTGATLFDGSKSPGRRVHFPASDNTFLGLNANGLKLFDAAVRWAANIAEPAPGAARGKQTYAIGLNFGSNEPKGALVATDVVGAALVAQGNWNNLGLLNGTNTTVVAEVGAKSDPTTVRVQWASNNTWASTGRGEENNRFPTNSADRALMTGYLDTGNATTTSVTISGLPTQLTSAGYDVYVYAMGGVGGRGGGFRILDATSKAVLKDYVRAQSGTNYSTYVQVPVPPASGTHGAGNYIVFSGLNSSSIIIEATTAGGLGFSGTPRAPINAIQLVTPASSAPPVKVAAERTATGLKVTFSGTLQSADSVAGPWADVAGAKSPADIPFAGSGKFYRSKQ